MDKFEENLDDFIAKAEKAHELVTLLQSKDLDVVKDTQNQIDNILKNDWEVDDDEYKTKEGFSKSQISRNRDDEIGVDESSAFPSDQAGFMKAVEEDANRRAANRQRREEKAKVRKENGNAAFLCGNYRKAVEEYEMAINLAGWNVCLYTNKAQAFIKLHEYDKAVDACERAIHIDEGFVKAYIQKSNALLAKACFPEAVACLELCLKNCKDSSTVITKYLKSATNMKIYDEENKKVINHVTQEAIKEFKHLIIKVKSDKVFEATIATEFTLKLLENNKDNCSLFRALGGLGSCFTHFQSEYPDTPLLSNLLDIFYSLLSQDCILLQSWNSLHPDWSTLLLCNACDQIYRKKLLLWLQKVLYHDNSALVSTILEGWTEPKLTATVLDSFSNSTQRPMTLLILPQLLGHASFSNRFKKDLLRQLKLISESLSSVSNGPLPEKKIWIASLSGLSLSALARLELDDAFWRLFLPLMESLDKAGDTDSVKELLIVAQNFTLDSKSLTERGTQISEVLVSMCGETCPYPQVPLLLNKVLQKCPNTVLADDKGQFGALLKIIKGYKEFDDDLNTAIKLLTRNTAQSIQARKWVCKYGILDVLLEMLSSGDVLASSSKTYSAILSNAALCCAHCFIDPKVCRQQEAPIVDLFLRHAKSEKGLGIQENASIAVARLATNNPTLLIRLREERGLEVLHSRFQSPI